MKVYVNIRQVGKKKDVIQKKEYHIEDDIRSVSELIRQFVTIGVSDFNKREILSYVSREEIKAQSAVGKIGFQDRENKATQDLDKAIENALCCYEDGIYRIFINGRLTGELKDSIEIKEGDEITFIRLTMLSGRMW